MSDKHLASRVMEAIPKDSIGRYDLLPITKDTALFREIVKYLAAPFIKKVDYIVSPEAIGWIIGVAVAGELGVGFIPIRKRGKLPYPKELLISQRYHDYSIKEKTLEIKKDTFFPGCRILIVDEWVETGASINCCIKLLEKENCIIQGIATIGIDYREETKPWIDSGFVRFVGRDM